MEIKSTKPRYWFCDVETGGTDPQTTSLLSFYCAITDKDFNVLTTLGEVHTVPNDGIYKVNSGAMNVNKIDLAARNDQDVVQTMNYQAAGLLLKNFLLGNQPGGRSKLIYVNHKADFDLGYIHQYLLTPDFMRTVTNFGFRDTKVLGAELMDAGIFNKHRGNLAAWADAVGFTNPAPHTGEGDVLTTIAVYKAQRERLAELAKLL